MKWTVGVLLALLLSAPGVETQESGDPEYFLAVAEFFDVPADEIDILRGRGLPADELPVALFFARRAGVSVEALAALRRNGQSWSTLAGRYGIGADALHVPLADAADAGRLAGAYARYRTAATPQWGAIVLSDDEIIALVNVRLLSQTLDLPPVEILRRAGASGPFASRFRAFIR